MEVLLQQTISCFFRLSKQLMVVNAGRNATDGAKMTSDDSKNLLVSNTVKDVFKKPTLPFQVQRAALKPADRSLIKAPSIDVDMKSATSVVSMDLNVIDLTEAQDEKSESVSDQSDSLENNQIEKRSTISNNTVAASKPNPIITVQVVQDNVVDLTGETPTETLGEDKKILPKQKKESEKNATKKKKTTISEDTKMKLRDSVFANMFAKQKGMLATLIFHRRFSKVYVMACCVVIGYDMFTKQRAIYKWSANHK